ncbi:endo-polygalacturonase [Arachidicoccus terrestris]|nr:endo-polygalacturonase [Arachidicoccus terrestris]
MKINLISQRFYFALFVICFLSIIPQNNYAQSLRIYPPPSSLPSKYQNNDFVIKVRTPGGRWRNLYNYKVPVIKVINGKSQVEDASMASFDFEDSVEVSVQFTKGMVNTARVRPLSKGIKCQIKGNTLYFSLNRPGNLSVEVNGDIFHNLHLFANPIETFAVNKKDSNLIYFGPGLHKLKSGKLLIPSNKTVYVSGGAVIEGQLLVHNAHNVKIMGRGIIDPAVKMGVHIANSKNVTVEGIECTQCATGGSDSIFIKNVKCISYYGWGDGMNVFASSHVFYDNVFCRTSDDCTTVYGTRMGFVGGANDIVMRNSTLWADVAHPILIGTHGNVNNPDTLQNITYENIDILDHNEMQIDYQGCMSIDAGDENLIRNVTFKNIRIEDFRCGQLVNLRVFYNRKYCKAPGRAVENILFKDITYNGSRASTSIINGYDSTRLVKNVVFENLVINGQKISDNMPSKPSWYKTSDFAGFFVGDHTQNIRFK